MLDIAFRVGGYKDKSDRIHVLKELGVRWKKRTHEQTI